MAITNDEVVWYFSASSGSVGGALGAAMHDVQGTLTSATASGGFELFDNALGGSDGDNVGSWILLVTGSSALYAGLITDYEAATGRFTVSAPVTLSAGIGDVYRIFGPNDLHPEADADASANGTPDNRAIFVRNTSATDSLTENVIYVVPLDVGPFDYEIYCEDGSGSSASFSGDIADVEVGPSQAQLNALDADNEYSSPTTFNEGLYTQPRALVGSQPGLNSSLNRRVYVRRNLRGDSTNRASAAVLIVSEATDGSLNQVVSGAVLVFDAAGFTPDITVGFDRKIRIGGGARVQAEVRSVETGELVEDQNVGFSLDAGPGALETPPEGTDTDVNGRTFVSYIAPTNQGEAGNTVTVGARI